MNNIEIRDILDYKYISNAFYNPSGEIIVFDVANMNEEKNSYERNVWIIRDDKVSQLTSDINANAICFIDDNTLLLRRVAIDHEEGDSDYFTIDINGGEAKKAFSIPLAVSKIEPIKDGYVLLATINRDNPDAYKDSTEVRKKKLEEKNNNKDYQVVDEIPYWYNGAGFVNGERSALFLYQKGILKRLTNSYTDVSEFVVDGNNIYYTYEAWKRKRKFKDKVSVYNISSKKSKNLYSKNDLSIHNLIVYKNELYCQVTDKKEYGSNETPKMAKLVKGEFEILFKPDRTLHTSIGSDAAFGGGKGSKLYGDNYFTLATDEDHVCIYEYQKLKKKVVILDKPFAIKCLDVNSDKIVFVASNHNQLFEVYELRKGGKVSQLTNLNKEYLKDKYIAEPKRLNYKSCGLDLHGWVLLPDNFNPKKKYPAVLDIHGGPRVTYGTNFFHEMQVWASRGYVVMFTNIKGSDGRDDEFADIRDQYGFIDYDNLMDFVDAVLDEYPNIDKKKLCVTGGSYGGFMTNWIIGHTNRFACAVSQRSISNWISKALISDIGYYHNSDQHGAPHIFDGFHNLWKHSPLKYAKGIKTPTLFIHSDEDYRCPLPEGMQMMQALAVQNVETRMVIFHGENHELSRSGKPLHRIKRLEEITNWFDKHTK